MDSVIECSVFEPPLYLRLTPTVVLFHTGSLIVIATFAVVILITDFRLFLEPLNCLTLGLAFAELFTATSVSVGWNVDAKLV